MKNVMRSLAALTVLLLVAACYELEREAIPVSAGEIIPGQKDSGVVLGRSGRVTRSGQGNDYRFTETFGGRSRQGTFRAVRVQGDLWLVQARYDGDAFYNASFWRLGAGQPQRLEPRGDIVALATRHGVTREFDAVRGGPMDIANFLKAHAGLEMVVAD